MRTDQHVPTLDPAIRSYYERRPEEDRLEGGAAQLESFRTRQLLMRFAPPPPATVLDVGGAAGAYAIWLAEAGYTVHLVEPVLRLLTEAQRRSASAARELASCSLGDARSLAVEDGVIDFILLLGPLYHLTTKEERVRALSESARVLKPGGILFAAAISRWASALDALSRDLFQDPAFYDIVKQDLVNGQHRNPTDRTSWFTTAYFHRPDELVAEVNAAGLDLAGLFGLEGPCWVFSDFEERWADPRRRADLLLVAEAVETEPSMIGMSAHMLAVTRKPAQG
ncbi:MAG: class I SAM-dependent methyltransferase [Gemmatimonadota bacterium]